VRAKRPGTFKNPDRRSVNGDGGLHVLTKVLGIAWVAIVVVLGAHYAGTAAAGSAAAALLNYTGGVLSPVSILGGITLLWLVIDWRMSTRRKAREIKAIVRDKPALASDPKALRRERRIREREYKLQRQEEKTLRAEKHAEKRLAKDGRRETTLERRRETIEMKKERLHERQNPGR
jgi:hypothetical protein